MASRGPTYHNVMHVAALVAAVALVVKGVQELRYGNGWAMIAVAVLMVLLIVLRRFVYLD